MTLNNLKKLIDKGIKTQVNLIANEGDIYLCQVIEDDQQYLLTANNSKSPLIFHSISEATDYLGNIKQHINLLQHSAYDEMVGNLTVEETFSSLQVR